MTTFTAPDGFSEGDEDGDGDASGEEEEGDADADGLGASIGAPLSSSLSGRRGLGSPFFRTARYRPKFSAWSYDVMSSHCDPRP